MNDSRSGVGFGVAAYLCWGFFPLYWPLLDPAGSLEVLAHRFVWSMVFVLVAITAMRKWPAILAIARDRRLMLILGIASVTIAFNWGGFIYGVTNGHVIETSLGYFINPLVTVLLGVFVLKETLRPVQWLAVAIGAAAVVVLTIDYGRLPWVALLVAFSFAIYGFLKKKADLGAFESLGMETAILFPVALTFLIVLQLRGNLTFGHEGPANMMLLIGTGIVTAIPLLLFGAAATRLSLTTTGLLQYLGPILQFATGLLIFREDMTGARWAGFVLVWLALAIFTVDAISSRRRIVAEPAPL
ncbi:EamA family transporter RarD [Aeromicrobium wangtongii]|uniref:EamA family transporter RarD n=1 Tax=Aeromicrobium wangtongii TaxID=2969247 RepID=A0ABY5M824_9ACTN|nr:EamA family transporter RarD [Aeromicrobium wangtongii]MCD9200016.1 EamA family transporter RarD [Aeromicrobium wangtongii]MCL3820208.1 EamA family transporter RarD [Aeromicrobium wangtongii]UUP13276.1 EamA family transporter RarD [Aeromicrobium wangtongii]